MCEAQPSSLRTKGIPYISLVPYHFGKRALCQQAAPQMVLLWEDGLALLDIQQEETTRYFILRPERELRSNSSKVACSLALQQQVETPCAQDPSLVLTPPQPTVAPNISPPAGRSPAEIKPKKRKRVIKKVLKPLNDQELQAGVRQAAPQAAVSAALQRLRAWLLISGHTTLAKALQTEEHICNATCSSGQDSSSQSAVHVASEPAAALPRVDNFSWQSKERPPASVRACPVCIVAWQCMSNASQADRLGHSRHMDSTSSIAALQLESDHHTHQSMPSGASCPNSRQPTAAPPALYSNHLQLSRASQKQGLCALESADSAVQLDEAPAGPSHDIKSIKQRDEHGCESATDTATLDLPALHKFKHLVKPKLVVCNQHCLLQWLESLRQSPSSIIADPAPKPLSGLPAVQKNYSSAQSANASSTRPGLAAKLGPPEESASHWQALLQSLPQSTALAHHISVPEEPRFQAAHSASARCRGCEADEAGPRLCCPPSQLCQQQPGQDSLGGPPSIGNNSCHSVKLIDQLHGVLGRTNEQPEEQQAASGQLQQEPSGRPVQQAVESRRNLESLAIVHGSPVVLPAGCTFLLSDISRLQPLMPRMAPLLCVLLLLLCMLLLLLRITPRPLLPYQYPSIPFSNQSSTTEQESRYYIIQYKSPAFYPGSPSSSSSILKQWPCMYPGLATGLLEVHLASTKQDLILRYCQRAGQKKSKMS